jgi:hypothetical protein
LGDGVPKEDYFVPTIGSFGSYVYRYSSYGWIWRNVIVVVVVSTIGHLELLAS